MAGSVNKVILVGNLGSDPEIRTMPSGDKMASFSVATSETWKDKTTGERKEKTEWHRVAVFNKGIVGVCENYIRKGSKVYIEGQLETRSWEQDGQKRYSTEVTLRPYRGELTMLDSKGSGGAANDYGGARDSGAPSYDAGPMGGGGQQTAAAPIDELEDEIPF